MNKKCIKCNNDMAKTPVGSNGSISITAFETVNVQGYVCLKCGYIEQYANIQEKLTGDVDNV